MTNARNPVRLCAKVLRALGALALAAVPILAGPLQITAVRFWSFGDITRVAIETTGEAPYHAERIADPDRLFLDLAGVHRQPGTHGVQVIPVNDRLVKQIRVALVEANVMRVVLDLAAPVESSISQLTTPNRIIIELRLAGHGPIVPPARSIIGGHSLAEPAPEKTEPPAIEPVSAPAPSPAPPPGPAPLAAPEPPAPERALSTPPRAAEPRENAADQPVPPRPARKPERAAPKPSTETALAAKRDSHGDRSLIRALGLKLERVVIDPGHGGHDTGTIGPHGLMEKDLVLDVAKRLGTLISERLGSEVIYTRTDDTFVPLEERTRLANEKRADLFLSIHANSSRSGKIAGSETFYLNFTTSEDALEVAARENATSQTSIHELQNLVQQITLNEKVQESRELAVIMQRALYSGLPRNRSYKNRGIKKAPFVVLIGAQMPSVLTEIAFLSNPRDENLLKRSPYRQKVAEALFKGVQQYASALSHTEVARQRQSASQTQ